MKKLKLATLTAVVAVFAAFTMRAEAAGIGFIDYQKVQENYSFAIQAVKEVEAKGLELQQYMLDKDKQYKSIDTPIKRQNFEDATKKEFKAKEEAFLKLKMSKEEQIYKKIHAATKDVMVEQKLDAIVDFRVMFVGGLDITDLVIQKLKTGKY